MRIMDSRVRLGAVIVLAAIAISLALFALRPKARRGRPAPVVPIVSTLEAVPGSFPMVIEAGGTVVPASKVDILPEVEGRVIYVSPALVPGGLVNAGEVLVRIDSADFDLEIRNMRALVAEARLNLETEKARQDIARSQWREDGRQSTADEDAKSLALRGPHIESAAARLDAARSRLEAAELALRRTEIASPFNAIVMEKGASRGQLVGRQRPVATLVDRDEFWVEAALPLEKLSHISFPGPGVKEPTPAEAVLDLGGGRELSGKAEAFMVRGDLDPEGRMARVLFRLPGPLETGAGGRFLIGSYVTLRIWAGSVEGAFQVPRSAVRDGDTLWVLSGDNTLEIRNIKVAWPRKDDLIVTGGLAAGDRIITSSIQSPVPGMALAPEGQAGPRAAPAGGGGPG